MAFNFSSKIHPNKRSFAGIAKEMCIRDRFHDIGYHFYIRKDGTMTQHRKLLEVGAHARPYNRCSSGICYEGGLDEQGKPCNTMTTEQLTVLRHRTILTDVEVVADVIKPTGLMVKMCIRDRRMSAAGSQQDDTHRTCHAQHQTGDLEAREFIDTEHQMCIRDRNQCVWTGSGAEGTAGPR